MHIAFTSGTVCFLACMRPCHYKAFIPSSLYLHILSFYPPTSHPSVSINGLYPTQSLVKRDTVEPRGLPHPPPRHTSHYTKPSYRCYPPATPPYPPPLHSLNQHLFFLLLLVLLFLLYKPCSQTRRSVSFLRQVGLCVSDLLCLAIPYMTLHNLKSSQADI